MQDLRFAFRQLLKTPGFAAVAMLALALATVSCSGIRRSDALPETVREPFARPATVPVLPLRSVEPGTDRADLAPLRTIIGNARVVALGQPALGVHEPLSFRNRLLEYLVEELGFTAIAVESAFPESRRLADYVAGGPGTAEEILTETRTWWHEPLEENLQLVRWLRAHNTDPSRKHPVRFYAIDLSYTGPWGSRPTPAALDSALAYLGRVDPASAHALGAVFEPWLSRLANPMVSWTRPEQDACTAAVDDLVALLERERVAYLAAAPAADYEWAHRAALVAQQADRMFRVAPTDPPGERVPPSAWRMVNARDTAMAENVLWALGQEGPAGRVLVVTHYLHAQSAPTMGGPWDAFERMPTAMGQFLRASLGDDLVVIGLSEAATVERYVKSTAAFDALVTVESLTPARPARGAGGPDGRAARGVRGEL
ncbi:MAG: erythromycin esterase family protein [Verrucomicrobiae bacterium]|nr:erythromycin esterase family protein [Verrucomicrobiae bacterium]